GGAAAVAGDRSTRQRMKTGDGAQDGGFAAAARAEQAHQRSGGDLERQVAYRDLVGVCAGDAVDFEQGCQGPTVLSRNSSRAFCACRRFSAWSNTTLCGPSMTSLATS